MTHLLNTIKQLAGPRGTVAIDGVRCLPGRFDCSDGSTSVRFESLSCWNVAELTIRDGGLVLIRDGVATPTTLEALRL